MNAKAPDTADRPSGKSISDQILCHDPNGSFADVAHSLTDAHAHRPGVWQDDLNQATAAFHQTGLLPGLDLVGVRGQDLIARDELGKVQVFDSTQLSRHHEDKTSSEGKINGRDSWINPDGSGAIVAGHTDHKWNGWGLAKDVLKSQGNEHPTDNQVANFAREIEKFNGKPMTEIKEGEMVKLPPSTKGGDHTEFGDKAEALAGQSREQTQAIHDDAKAALVKFAGRGTIAGYDLGNANITREEVDKALAYADLTEQQRRGLTFIHNNYDTLAQQDGKYTPNGNVYVNGLDQWQNDEAQKARRGA